MTLKASRTIRALTASVLTAALTAGCSSLPWKDDEKSSSDDGGKVNWPEPAKVPEEAPDDMSRVAPTTNCPQPPERTAQASSPGQLQGLEVNVDTIWSGSHSHDLAFDDKALARMPEALTETGRNSFDFDGALQKGAYAAFGATAAVTMQNYASGSLQITDVHPVNIVRECLPLAAAVYLLAEGGDPPPVSFNMDAAAPAARDGQSGELYFEKNNAINLDESNQENIELSFDTVWGAYSFDIAFEYSLAGQHYTALLNNRGVPFRIAAGLCGQREQIAGLSDEAQQRLKSVRFQRMRGVGDGFDIIDKDPEAYAAECPW